MWCDYVSLDLGHRSGQDYLVLAGRDPGWSMGRPLKKRDTKLITDILEGWLLEYGKPVSIRSDGGARFLNLFRARCDSHHTKPRETAWLSFQILAPKLQSWQTYGSKKLRTLLPGSQRNRNKQQLAFPWDLGRCMRLRKCVMQHV